MRLNFKQLKSMDVETLSGTDLGSVYDLVWDIDSNLVVQLAVRKITAPTKNYLINTTQIVRVEENKIIVDDNVQKESKHKYPKNIVSENISSM